MAGTRKPYYKNRADDIRFGRILESCTAFLADPNKDKLTHNTYARIIGTLLYEMSPIHSGLISKECVLAWQRALATGKSFHKTKEHFRGRQEGGVSALRHVLSSSSVSPFVIRDIVDDYRQVHYTSSAENTALKGIITANPSFADDWKQAYRAGGIELGDYVCGKRALKYDLSTFKLP